MSGETNDLTAVMALQRQHCSQRSFRDRPVDESLLLSILESAQCAASSSFIQGYSIVRITDGAARAAIAKAAGDQAWVVEAPEFLVFCADLLRSNEACRLSGRGTLGEYTEQFLAAIIDTALLAQNVALAAESAGLGGVFIGGIRNDPALIADILSLPPLVFPAFGFCLGWPDEPCEPKPRMPLEAVLHTDRYDRDKVADQLRAYDRVMADYYASRSRNRKQSDWTEQTAATLQKKKRAHMLAFLRRQGFLRR